MAEFSNYLENALINAVLRNTSYTSPATVYVALYTTDPTDADTGTEVSGNAYARQSVAFSSPSNGVTSNSAAVEFPQATGSWGTVAYIGLRDASSGGNLLFHTALDASKTIATGDVFRIAIGSLTVTLT
jgi:hypothetical protein